MRTLRSTLDLPRLVIALIVSADVAAGMPVLRWIHNEVAGAIVAPIVRAMVT